MTYSPGSKDDPAIKAIKGQFDRDPASVSPEGRIALANAGLVANHKGSKAGQQALRLNNAPLSASELARMRALQAELSIRQTNGTAHRMGVSKLELGDLLERHKRSGVPSPAARALESVAISSSAKLAGLRAAKQAAEQAQNWSEAATLMSAIAAIEAGVLHD
jgi:hypothetical protein